MTAGPPRRLGRPPTSNSAETRRRILEVALESFAELGYGVTTNKDVATKAGITTGALYHYFDSKRDMYLAVYDHVQATVFTLFDEAMATSATFVGQLEALLETAYRINAEQRGLASFLGAARIDMTRHEELRSVDGRPGEGTRFLDRLVSNGVRTGEILPAQRDQVVALVRTVFVGLVVGVSNNPKDHRDAISGIEALLEGRLLHPPKPARTPGPGRRSTGRAKGSAR